MKDSDRDPEDVIRRFNLWLLAFVAAIGLGAILFVLPHGRPEETIPRLVIPWSVFLSSLVAILLTYRGLPGVGAALVIASGYSTVLYYVVVGGYGLHSYALGLYALLIVATALMIGHVAGLAASVIASVTAIVLFVLERDGLFIHAEAARTIPLPNILLVNLILYATTGFLLYVFSKSFRSALRSVDLQGKHLQQLIELAPQGYVLHRDGTILMLNHAAAAAAGFDVRTGTRHTIFDLLHPDTRADAEEKMRAASALAPGSSIAAEFRRCDARGRDGLYETWTTPVLLEDGAALLTIVRDVTRERAAADALALAKAQAEAANHTKSQFLANMSHEIRTPMNAVLGLSELLLASNLDQEQRERAQGIRSSARALLGVINDVLDVARIEAGKTELVEELFEPRVLLEDVKAMLQPLAEEKGLTFELRIAAGVPLLLKGDAGRLRQILINLAGNAIKFSERGRVEIEAELAGSAQSASTLAEAEAIELRLRVADTGPGIAAAQIGTLFDRFIQADATDTRRHGGAGLGLYIAREFAQMMEGDISVQSVLGGGSRFEVVVRLRIPDAAEASRHELRQTQLQQSRDLRPAAPFSILLAEDNEINQLVARSMLEAAGHRVTLAADGAQAVASCAAAEFDCVLMDCQMPVMDGIEATQRIRAQEQEAGRPRTPVIALTANAMRGDRERYLAAGMDAFLAKPFDSDALLALIAQTVTRPVTPNSAPESESSAGKNIVDSAAQPGSEATFDPRALEQLARLDQDSPGLLRSLVARFLSNTPELISQIAAGDGTAESVRDASEMERAAHSLKSTCARFGAVGLATLAAEAEQAVRAGDLAKAQQIGSVMRGEFARFEQALRRHPAVSAAV